MLFLTACTATKTITKTEYVYVTPPEAYVQTYEIPEFKGDKNRDLLMWSLDLQEVLKMHNQDKKALQDWIDAVGDKNDSRTSRF